MSIKKVKSVKLHTTLSRLSPPKLRAKNRRFRQKSVSGTGLNSVRRDEATKTSKNDQKMTKKSPKTSTSRDEFSKEIRCHKAVAHVLLDPIFTGPRGLRRYLHAFDFWSFFDVFVASSLRTRLICHWGSKTTPKTVPNGSPEPLKTASQSILAVLKSASKKKLQGVKSAKMRVGFSPDIGSLGGGKG